MSSAQKMRNSRIDSLQGTNQSKCKKDYVGITIGFIWRFKKECEMPIAIDKSQLDVRAGASYKDQVHHAINFNDDGDDYE